MAPAASAEKYEHVGLLALVKILMMPGHPQIPAGFYSTTLNVTALGEGPGSQAVRGRDLEEGF